MNKILAVIVFLSGIASSCNHGDFDYSQYYSTDNQELSYGDTLSFSYLPKDSGVYNIYLSVRYTDQYEFSNLWLKVLTKDDTSRVDISLFDNAGVPYGKCTGGVCTQTVLLEKVKLNNQDSIQYNIIQNMRKSPLGHISEVGLIIQSDTAQ
ncbi:MAG: gliding motility lipoprotein GldH [Chitinophagales bacterium]|nr:gliding motility lipoprotein GldH [Chitinophagales bacterium]